MSEQDYRLSQVADCELTRLPNKFEKDPERVVEHRVCKSGGNIKALIFHDSFGRGLKPFIHTIAKESLMVWSQLSQESLNYYLETFKPDLVIEERVERLLPRRPIQISAAHSHPANKN